MRHAHSSVLALCLLLSACSALDIGPQRLTVSTDYPRALSEGDQPPIDRWQLGIYPRPAHPEQPLQPIRVRDLEVGARRPMKAELEIPSGELEPDRGYTLLARGFLGELPQASTWVWVDPRRLKARGLLQRSVHLDLFPDLRRLKRHPIPLESVDWLITGFPDSGIGGKDGLNPPFLRFDLEDRRVFGFSGCRSLGASVSVKNESNELRLDVLSLTDSIREQSAQTRDCQISPAAEARLIGALQSARFYQRRAGWMTLLDRQRRPLLYLHASARWH